MQDKTTEDSGVAENGKTADQTNPEDVQKKPKKRKTTKELIVKSTVPQLSEKELNMLIEKEMELIMQVKLEKQRTDAINAVEEYVYHMRDNIHGDLQDYILEQVRLTYILDISSFSMLFDLRCCPPMFSS